MANFQYQCSFANVPLLLNTAKIVKLDFNKGSPQGKPESILKHQPLDDLEDELNKLIANNAYLQDYGLVSDSKGRDLDAIAGLSPANTHPTSNGLRIGDYYYPPSASRWSVYRGLATSSMVKTIINNLTPLQDETDPETSLSLWKSASFVMKAPSINPQNPQGAEDNYTIQTNLFMLPPRPLAEHGSQFDGLYLITLVDERYYWQFRTISLQFNELAHWDMLIYQLANAFNLEITDDNRQLFWDDIQAVYSWVEPDSQLWSTEQNAAALFDAVAANIGCTVVRNLNGTYGLVTSVYSQQIVQANLLGIGANLDPGTILLMNPGETGYPTNPYPARIAGGDMFYSGGANLPVGDLLLVKNSLVPTNGVNVSFPMYIAGDDPVPHFVNSRYRNQRPSSYYEDNNGDVYVVNVPLSSGGGVSGGGWRPEDLTGDFAGVFFASGNDLGTGSITSGLVGSDNLTHTIHCTAKAIFSSEDDI